jgi:hypothetical protein
MGQEPPHLAWFENCRRIILTIWPVKIEQDFIDCETLRRFPMGDVMCDCQNRESHAQMPGCTASARCQTDAVDPRMQHEEPIHEREGDLRRSLHSLQECVCELLIQNQVLRMGLLASTTKLQSGEDDQ